MQASFLSKVVMRLMYLFDGAVGSIVLILVYHGDFSHALCVSCFNFWPNAASSDDDVIERINQDNSDINVCPASSGIEGKAGEVQKWESED